MVDNCLAQNTEHNDWLGLQTRMSLAWSSMLTVRL